VEVDLINSREVSYRMPETLYIMGHKNPDTDSICSAIAYAEFKRQLGISAVPVRLGAINRETEFVLSYFNIEPPELITTVRTQVSDISFERFGPASPNISIKNAWEMMKNNSYRVVPVVNEMEELLGLVTQLHEVKGKVALSEVEGRHFELATCPKCNLPPIYVLLPLDDVVAAKLEAAIGKKVEYLKRIKMGNLNLDNNLELGEYRKLTEEELGILRNFL
jgi:hypothetical protein